MLILAVLVVIPAVLAFKRGHNGYIITACSIACFILSFLLGILFKSNVVYLGLFFASWLLILAYCILVKGESGDQLAIQGKIIDSEEEEEEVDITSDDFVLLKTYTESWRQSELMDDIQKLIDAKIPHRSKSGLMATIMVKEKDFEAAATVIDLNNKKI